METQIPYLKADAVVPVELGTGYVQRLQQVLLYLIGMRTSEEIEKMRKKMEAKQALEEWMEPIATMTYLLNSIEQKASQLDLIEYRTMTVPDQSLPPAE